MNAPLLSVQDLVTTVRLGQADVPAVNQISFDLHAGQALGLVGESGSGKSLTALSLMRILAEPRVRIAGGRIDFEGRDLATLAERQLQALRGNRLAMIFQEPSTALNPVQTVGHQVGEPLRIHRRFSRAQARDQAISLLEQVGIPEARARANAYPHQLSGGMKQRAMIAMALCNEPALLIADEPTTALDVTVQAQILDLLARLRRERNMALMLITHDLGVVAETCDAVAVMYGGRIVEQGPAAQILKSPHHPYTAGLLAAVNELHQGHAVGRSLTEIPGAVPALGALPAGCAFAPRCRYAQDRCRTEAPALRPIAADQLVRCHFPLEAVRS